jgi:hypothetical protein
MVCRLAGVRKGSRSFDTDILLNFLTPAPQVPMEILHRAVATITEGHSGWLLLGFAFTILAAASRRLVSHFYGSGLRHDLDEI